MAKFCAPQNVTMRDYTLFDYACSQQLYAAYAIQYKLSVMTADSVMIMVNLDSKTEDF